MWSAIAAALLTLWLSAVSWLTRRQISLNHDNAKELANKVDREEYNGTINRLEDKLDATSRKLEAKITTGNNRIYDQMKEDTKEQRARDEKLIAAIHSKNAGGQ